MSSAAVRSKSGAVSVASTLNEKETFWPTGSSNCEGKVPADIAHSVLSTIPPSFITESVMSTVTSLFPTFFTVALNVLSHSV